MLNIRSLFREYILFRSRMVAYVAAVLFILGLLGLAARISGDARSATRFGLLIQLAGVSAIAPDLFGARRSRYTSWLARATAIKPARQDTAPPYSPSLTGTPGKQYFNYYLEHNRPVMIGNMITSIVLIWALGIAVFTGPPGQLAWESIALLGLAGLGFAWINLFLLTHIQLMLNDQVPAGLASWFLSVDLPVTILGLLFAGLVHILLRWMPRIGGFIFRNGIQRVLMLVTLPCFLVGLVLQLLATFLPGYPTADPFELSLLLRLWAAIRSITG